MDSLKQNLVEYVSICVLALSFCTKDDVFKSEQNFVMAKS